MIYTKDANGKTVKIDVFSYPENGKIWLYANNVLHHLKLYYRHEKTWDDHLGNTPCGYYINVPMPYGKRKRIYIHYKGVQ